MESSNKVFPQWEPDVTKTSEENADFLNLFAMFDEERELRRKKQISDSEAAKKRACVHVPEPIDKFRKGLPVHKYKESLLKAIADYQVLVIVGNTGCGKTTQIPQYLHEAGYTKSGKLIGCRQPGGVAAASIVAARVSSEMKVQLGNEVGYHIAFDDRTSDTTVIKYMSDETLVQELLREPDLASYSVMIFDEANQRTFATEMLFSLVKAIVESRPDLKLLFMSASSDVENLSEFFGWAPIFKIPGRRFPVEIHYTKEEHADYLDVAIDVCLDIHETEPYGEILVILGDQHEVETAKENLRKKTQDLDLDLDVVELRGPIHLWGRRKVFVASNIEEVPSWPDIQYVIDSGVSVMKAYNYDSGKEELVVTPISKLMADRRAGLAGQTGPGKCYRLYTAYSYYNQRDDNIFEARNLENVVMISKCLGVHDLRGIGFLNPPNEKRLLEAEKLLGALGAIEKDGGELTHIGRKMAKFYPLDPRLSRMIVASEEYGCTAEIITIAAMTFVDSGSSIFYVLENHARLLKDYKIYNYMKESKSSILWAGERFNAVNHMESAILVRGHLEGLLERADICLTSTPTPTPKPSDLVAIKKAITSGLVVSDEYD